jgi:multimeric flavodoxin WrbA
MKMFGGVVVGSARNGGQETLLHALADSMLTQQMILAVDGVPTSHWGATFWNQKDSIAEDEFGKETAINLGKRIAELATFIR